MKFRIALSATKLGDGRIKMNEKSTRSEEIIRRIANSKALALPIALGIIFLALLSIAEGVQKAGDILGKAMAISQVDVLYDGKTTEGLLSIFRKIDEFLLLAERGYYSKDNKEPWILMILGIKADLNTLITRNKYRPLNSETVSQIEKLSKIMGDVDHDLDGDWKENYGKAYMSEYRKLVLTAIELCIQTEELKKESEE